MPCPWWRIETVRRGIHRPPRTEGTARRAPTRPLPDRRAPGSANRVHRRSAIRIRSHARNRGGSYRGHGTAVPYRCALRWNAASSGWFARCGGGDPPLHVLLPGLPGAGFSSNAGSIVMSRRARRGPYSQTQRNFKNVPKAQPADHQSMDAVEEAELQDAHADEPPEAGSRPRGSPPSYRRDSLRCTPLRVVDELWKY